MATYTAGDVINRALRLLGVLAEGETPSASESVDSLMALNQMLDSWSTESLAVFAAMDQVFTWSAGESTYTLGPSGDFVGNRPVLLDDSTYYVINGISYPIQIVNEAEFNSITVKGLQSALPNYIAVNPTMPDSTIYIWPVPTQNVEMHFISVAPLVEAATLLTNLTFPPGYIRAFVYNLAMELAPEFGVEPSRQVQRVAMTSKRNIKRINGPDDVLDIPGGIPQGTRHFNIYTGD